MRWNGEWSVEATSGACAALVDHAVRIARLNVGERDRLMRYAQRRASCCGSKITRTDIEASLELVEQCRAREATRAAS